MIPHPQKDVVTSQSPNQPAPVPCECGAVEEMCSKCLGTGMVPPIRAGMLQGDFIAGIWHTAFDWAKCTTVAARRFGVWMVHMTLTYSNGSADKEMRVRLGPNEDPFGVFKFIENSQIQRAGVRWWCSVEIASAVQEIIQKRVDALWAVVEWRTNQGTNVPE